MFAQADCAFFQTSAVAAERDAFPLDPADFAAVNPNTGTAPVFRTPRDAAITRAIYARLPVLVDRTGPEPVQVWPVGYMRMFDMTNDSGLFRTAAELRALGAYEVAWRRWEKGDQAWAPLFEGKMVQAYDHRAASVVVNIANFNRPAQPEAVTDAQHADSSWVAQSQFLVDENDIPLEARADWLISYKMITAPTNMRTMIAAIIPGCGVGRFCGLMAQAHK